MFYLVSTLGVLILTISKSLCKCTRLCKSKNSQDVATYSDDLRKQLFRRQTIYFLILAIIHIPIVMLSLVLKYFLQESNDDARERYQDLLNTLNFIAFLRGFVISVLRLLEPDIRNTICKRKESLNRSNTMKLTREQQEVIT